MGMVTSLNVILIKTKNNNNDNNPLNNVCILTTTVPVTGANYL